MLHTKIVDTKKEKILTSNAEKFIKGSDNKEPKSKTPEIKQKKK